MVSYVIIGTERMKDARDMLTVDEIRKRLQNVGQKEFTAFERSLAADTRKGVQSALRIAKTRVTAERNEEIRLLKMYSYEQELCGECLYVGMDEVGRGPLAGPLAIGAVVLPREPLVKKLDDSKKIKEGIREEIARDIQKTALFWNVQFIEPDEIDAAGIGLCLRMAFSRALRTIEENGIEIKKVLIDGHPLGIDSREINVIKGDGCCASIAAASIVAKVERDSVMRAYAEQYPQYGFDTCKGYASAEHIAALKTYGLTSIHRKSFCTNFFQESLF